MAPTAGEEAEEASRSQSARRRLRAAAATHKETGEASSSLLLESRRRRRPAISTSPTVGGVSQSEEEHPGERKSKHPSKKRKKTRAEDDTAPSKKRKKAKAEVETAASSASAATEQGYTSDTSSAVSSPICRPVWDSFLREGDIKVWSTVDSETHAVYDKLRTKYNDKLDRHSKIVTLEKGVPVSCLVNRTLYPVRDSGTKIIFQVAKAVVGFSSYVDGKLLNRSSGFLVEWGEERNTSTFLTSAHLIRVKALTVDEWSGKHQYVPDAKVLVHLLDDEETAVVARLLYYDKHYNIAMFRIDMDLGAQIPRFRSDELMFGQEIFVLGRDADLNLKIDHGNVRYAGPTLYCRHHYMIYSCVIAKCGVGGPVIDFDGAISGLANIPGNSFIPSCIIQKCLDMWKFFSCIPRLHMGMRFSAIKFLDPVHVEKISRKCNVDLDAGLIVEEVSGGSVAEKIGIRAGDIIQCLNGECIATTVELEYMLMSICENLLDTGKGTGSVVDMTADIFHIRKKSHSTKKLLLKLSDEVEIIAKGTCIISPRHCGEDVRP